MCKSLYDEETKFNANYYFILDKNQNTLPIKWVDVYLLQLSSEVMHGKPSRASNKDVRLFLGVKFYKHTT